MDPTKLLRTWQQMSRLPGGKQLFSVVLGRMVPYTGSISPRFLLVEAGHVRVALHDHHRHRNHLRSLHAIALMNIGEVATGVAMYTGLPQGGRGIVTNLSMTYKKKARGTIIAEARCELPDTAGRHDVVIDGVLRDQAGDTVAQVQATWRVQIP